jgi:hypothetical protein
MTRLSSGRIRIFVITSINGTINAIEDPLNILNFPTKFRPNKKSAVAENEFDRTSSKGDKTAGIECLNIKFHPIPNIVIKIIGFLIIDFITENKIVK